MRPRPQPIHSEFSRLCPVKTSAEKDRFSPQRYGHPARTRRKRLTPAPAGAQTATAGWGPSRSPAPSGQCGRRFSAECRMGPASFAQASPGEAGGNAVRRRRARKRGRRKRRPEQGRERLEHREEGQCRGKRASALPGTTARGDRGRKVPQAKNDSFLPSWHPAPGARSVRSPARQPSDLPLHLPERRRRRTEQRATGSRAADAIQIKMD